MFKCWVLNIMNFSSEMNQSLRVGPGLRFGRNLLNSLLRIVSRRTVRTAVVSLPVVLALALPAFATEIKNPSKLPVIKGKEAVASVGGEPVTVDEFNRTIGMIHEELSGQKQAKRIDYAEILDRLIAVKLVVLEARNIGLDGLQEVKDFMKDYSLKTLIQLEVADYLKDTKPDPDLVQKFYKGYAKQYRLKSVTFKVKSFASEAEKKMAGGKRFEKVVSDAVKKGIAKGDIKGSLTKPDKLLLPVAESAARLKVGQISPVISAGVNNYVIVKLAEVAYPKDPEAMKRAQNDALQYAKVKRYEAYVRELIKKHVKEHKDVLKALDKLNYASKKFDMAGFMKDKRVLAEVDGGQPVTVGELGTAMNKYFYHGTDKVANKKVLTVKDKLFNDILDKRVLAQQARVHGLDKTERYKQAVSDREDGILFAEFMKRVVSPDVTVKPAELKTYYKAHLADFSTPRMVKVRSLVFAKQGDAQTASRMLERGDSFSWVKANAAGQLPKGQKGALDFGEGLITFSSMPGGAQKLLADATEGSERLFAYSNLSYVLFVEKDVPAKPRSFDAVKEDIARKVYAQKFNQAAEGWVSKLKKAYKVQIYDETLRAGKPGASGDKAKTIKR